MPCPLCCSQFLGGFDFRRVVSIGFCRSSIRFADIPNCSKLPKKVEEFFWCDVIAKPQSVCALNACYLLSARRMLGYLTDLRFLTNKALQTWSVFCPCMYGAIRRATYRLTSGASLPPRLIAWLRVLCIVRLLIEGMGGRWLIAEGHDGRSGYSET
jgi:hypothetical protein